jgi:hypothetical protein
MGKKLLYEDILEAANKITNISRFGSGNYVIVSSKVADVFYEMELMEKRRNKLKKIMNKISGKR